MTFLRSCENKSDASWPEVRPFFWATCPLLSSFSLHWWQLPGLCIIDQQSWIALTNHVGDDMLSPWVPDLVNYMYLLGTGSQFAP